MSDAQRLPNLYQLLGLNGLESNREKIAAALKRAQAKADTLKADSARAADLARLQKVIALGQKYLLSPALKSNYDAQWSTIYGQADASPAAVPAEKLTAKSLAAREEPVVASVATTALPKSTADSSHQTHELFWDMAALDALLPPADPHEPFQMADYLRTSQVRDPMAAEADLRKLIALLGGEDLPASEQAASPSAPSQVFIGNERPTQFDAPGLSSAGLSSAGLSMPRSSSNTTAVGLAKRMRQKRQQAMLFGGTMLVAALGGLIVLAFYLNRPTPKPAEALAQTPKVPEPKLLDRNSSPDIAPATDPSSQLNDSSIAGSPASNTPLPNPSGLIQPGQNKPLEIQATPMKPDAMATSTSPAEAMKPEAMKPEPAKPDPAKPDPAKPDPAKPDPAKPDPAKPDPAKPDPAKPDPAKPDPTKPEPAKPDAKPETKPDAEPPADVKLSTRERRSWQEDMKRARAALSKLDPVASEKQLEELKSEAKTAAQRTQLATLGQAVGLIRRAREAMVAGIQGLESAQTFTVGNSTEVAFVEGDETRIIVRMAGSRHEYKLETIPAPMGIALMKLKPNVIDANLEAAMGVYVMVQLKKTANIAALGKKLLEDAAGLGTISKELAVFYDEDYKVQ